MIKTQTLQELESLVAKDPGKSCYELAGGKMFAVTSGDVSCLKGATRQIGETIIGDRNFTIYVGGAKK